MASNIYQADISPASGSLGYTGSPVQDKSAATKGAATAGLISTVGKEALAAHKGIAVGKAQAEDELTVDEFFQARETDSLVSGDDPLVKEAERDAAKLQQAAKSGAISSSELLLHLETRKRERIQSFPGYAQEFRKVYGDVLSDNKVRLSLVEAQEKSAAKAQADMEKFIRKDAHNLGFSDAWTAPLEQLIQKTTAVNGSKTYHTLYMNDVAKAKEAGASGYQSSELGRVSNFKTDLSSWIAQTQQELGRELTPEEVMQYGNGLADNYILVAKRSFGNTVDNSMYDNTRKVLESHVEDLNKVMSGQMTKEMMDNRNAQLEAVYKNEMLTNPTIGRAVVLAKALPPEISQSVFSFVRDNPAGTDLFVDMSKMILHGGSIPPSMPMGTKPYKDALSALTTQNIGLLKGKWDDYTPEQQADITTMVEGQSAILGDSRPAYGTEEADSLLDLASSNAFYQSTLKNPAMDNTRENTRHGVGRFVTDMNDQLMTALQGELDVPTKLINPDAGVLNNRYQLRDIVAVGFDEEGTMAFAVNHAVLEQVKDANAVAQVQQKVANLNKNFASRYNKAVKSWAHASGHQDYAKASKELIKRHGLEHLPDPQFYKTTESGLRPTVDDIVKEYSNPIDRISAMAEKGLQPQTHEEVFAITGQPDTQTNRMILDQANGGATPEFLMEQWKSDPEAIKFLEFLIGE